jgi:hypothetical protein
MNTSGIRNTGLRVKAGIKSGALGQGNHSRPGLKVKAGIKSGALGQGNHSSPGLKVRADVKAGFVPMAENHNGSPLPSA